jgi:hypothetical protein
VPTAWAVIGRHERALVGIGLDYVLIFVPFAAITASRLGVLDGGGSGLLEVTGNGSGFLAVCIAGTLIGACMILWGWRFEWHDPRPTPGPVRIGFAIFIIALLIVSTLLITGQPNVLPWQITPDLSLLFGFAFLGAASYFGFGLLEPRWENAAGQLLAFLAYDLVLIVPFLTRLPTIADEFRVGMILYIAVLVGSGVLAIWYLVVERGTRLGALGRTAEMAPPA